MTFWLAWWVAVLGQLWHFPLSHYLDAGLFQEVCSSGGTDPRCWKGSPLHLPWKPDRGRKILSSFLIGQVASHVILTLPRKIASGTSNHPANFGLDMDPWNSSIVIPSILVWYVVSSVHFPDMRYWISCKVLIGDVHHSWFGPDLHWYRT